MNLQSIYLFLHMLNRLEIYPQVTRHIFFTFESSVNLTSPINFEYEIKTSKNIFLKLMVLHL